MSYGSTLEGRVGDVNVALLNNALVVEIEDLGFVCCLYIMRQTARMRQLLLLLLLLLLLIDSCSFEYIVPHRQRLALAKSRWLFAAL